jgi:hypothetical protein
MWSLSTFAAAWELRMKSTFNGRTCLRTKGSIKLKGCGSRPDLSITLSEWNNLSIVRRTSLQMEKMKMTISTYKISPWLMKVSGSGTSLEPKILFLNYGRSWSIPWLYTHCLSLRSYWYFLSSKNNWKVSRCSLISVSQSILFLTFSNFIRIKRSKIFQCIDGTTLKDFYW